MIRRWENFKHGFWMEWKDEGIVDPGDGKYYSFQRRNDMSLGWLPDVEQSWKEIEKIMAKYGYTEIVSVNVNVTLNAGQTYFIPIDLKIDGNAPCCCRMQDLMISGCKCGGR